MRKFGFAVDFFTTGLRTRTAVALLAQRQLVFLFFTLLFFTYLIFNVEGSLSSLSSVKLDDSVIQLSDTVKILGATLDSSLTMGPHTKATSNSCFYHIRSFRQIRSSMDHTMAISVASALVSSRLDYVNSVLFGCPQKHAARLQRVQQALARVVMQQSSPLTSTELLKQLHWFPIEWRIRFKLASLVHKILNTGHPPYLTELIQYHKP